MEDGSVQVTETVRMTFEGGPFTYLSRELALEKTDGIDVLGASMDGRVMPRGTDAGQFEIRTGDSRVAVRWHFAGTSDSTHEFRLSYVAHGVVQQTGTGPLLEWQAHPTEHPYRIASSRIAVEGLAADRAPSIRSRHVGDTREERAGSQWVIEARDIGRNGWVMVALPTTVAAGVVPRWQRREREQRARAPQVLQIAAGVAVLCIGFVLLISRQYPPLPILDPAGAADAPPAPRPPAIAAAILAGGHATNGHAPGTLFDLASRNALSIAAAESAWKARRSYTLTRNDGVPLAPHESALLDVLFKKDQSVSWSAAASRLARGGRSFRRAVNEELLRLGLTDEQRRVNRRRLLVAGFVLLAVSFAALLVVLAMAAGPWGLTIPLGIDLAAVLAIGLGATRVELSDEGVRERQRWKAFKRTLKGSIASTGAQGPEDAAARYLPYVAALGLGVAFSRYLKSHGAAIELPPWFRALAGDDGSAAFVAFIGTTSSSTGAGAAGSGAAGGGSSSAG